MHKKMKTSKTNMKINTNTNTFPLAERDIKNSERKLGLNNRYNTQWIRFSKYEIKLAENERRYLVPQDSRFFEMYDPFDEAERLLVDTLELGHLYGLYMDEMKEVHLNPYRKRKTDKMWSEIEKALMDFVHQFGLLGFMNSSTYNHNVVGDEIIVLTDKNSLGLLENKMMGKDYMALFTPFMPLGSVETAIYRERMFLSKFEDTPKFYGKRPPVMDLIFSSFYAEDIQWILSYAFMLSTHYDQLQTYKNSPVELTEPVTILVDQFQASKIGFTITYGETTSIEWEFDSLKTAIQTMYGFALTEGASQIKRCQHCSSFFFAGSEREVYCSAACRNRHNVKRSRARSAEGSKDL